MVTLLIFAGIVAGILVVKFAADRFAAAKLRDGEWDENGPKHPTSPEPRHRTAGRLRLDNAFANLAPAADAEPDRVDELRERDLPGIAELVQQILDLLLDGSHPTHGALRAQLPSVRTGDIYLAARAMEIRLVVPTSAPRCTPPAFEGGEVEVHVEGIAEPPTAGAVVDAGWFSAVTITTFRCRWPRDAEILDLRLKEPLIPTEF